MMEKLTKAVGYIRISTPEQVHEGESLTTQRKQVEEYIEQKGWREWTLHQVHQVVKPI